MPKLTSFSHLTPRSSVVLKGVSAATISTYASSAAIPFEWIYGIIGGSFIGGSSAMYLLFHGRIAGISGIFGRVLEHTFTFGRNPNKLGSCSQFGFLTGLFSGGIYWNMLSKHNDGIDLYGYLPSKIEPFEEINYSPYIMAVSGILVGIGTRVGSGCTSGHGISGLARQSIRSVVAVSTFMTMAAITTTITSKYLPHLYNLEGNDIFKLPQLSTLSQYGVPIIAGALLCGSLYAGMRGFGNENINSLLPSLLCGLGFSTGLIYSGMAKPEKIRGFLNLDTVNFKEHFDPTMAFVFIGALGMTVPLYPLIIRFMKEPLFSKVWYYPTNKIIDRRLVIGTSIFGLGWGLGGICPGPGMLGLTSEEYSSPLWIWFTGLIFGMRFACLF